jgi:hypothetical protein
MVLQAVKYPEVVRKQHDGALCAIAIAYEIGKTSLSKESHASCHIPLCPISQSESSELSPALAQYLTLPTLFKASFGSAPMLLGKLYPAKSFHPVPPHPRHAVHKRIKRALVSDHACENQTILLWGKTVVMVDLTKCVITG